MMDGTVVLGRPCLYSKNQNSKLINSSHIGVLWSLGLIYD
jgi:hypothetical protein